MEFFSQLFQAMKSPRTALVFAIFSGALLFVPFERIGVTQPQFTQDYQTQILVVFVFALAILSLEAFEIILALIGIPFRVRANRKQLNAAFYSLNLNELCVLWSMTQTGMKTIKADYHNPVMISLRQKGCLGLLTGPQNMPEAHHYMPDALFKVVREKGHDRFPNEFKNSVRFEDELREIVRQATDWHRF